MQNVKCKMQNAKCKIFNKEKKKKEQKLIRKLLRRCANHSRGIPSNQS